MESHLRDYHVLKVINEPDIDDFEYGEEKYIYLTIKDKIEYIVKVGIITKCRLGKHNIKEEIRIIQHVKDLTPQILDYWESTIDGLLMGFLVLEKWNMRFIEYPKKDYLPRMTYNAIKRMHEMNIIHGDLHEGNIMIKDEVIGFIDFENSFIVNHGSEERLNHILMDYGFTYKIHSLNYDEKVNIAMNYEDSLIFKKRSKGGLI